MAKASLVNEVLIALGLKQGPQPASVFSLILLYSSLIIDVVFILGRILTLILMWRDWCRKKSEIRRTFFAFCAVYFLIDVPRIGLYSMPVLFSYGHINKIKILMFVASYYKIYWNLARVVCLAALSWNRFAVLVLGQRSVWNTERSGPSVFLLLLMPLLPTVVCSTIPQTYGEGLETVICYICLGFSGFFLFFAFWVSIKEILYPRHTEKTKFEEIILMAFPIWILGATVTCYFVEALAVKSRSEFWTQSDTNQAVVTGLQILYALLVDTVSFLGLFIICPKFRKSIFQSPLPTK